MSANVEVRTLPVSPPATVEPATGSRWTEAACRVLDIVVAALLLVLLAPVFAVIAIAIRIDSPGGPIFRQERLGRGLAAFMINKFRTMGQGVESETHRVYVQGLIAGDGPDDNGMFKMAQDVRVTRVGHFLRRSSLDELPQLWNVLRGEMSLVGPRPPIDYEVDHYPAHW